MGGNVRVHLSFQFWDAFKAWHESNHECQNSSHCQTRNVTQNQNDHLIIFMCVIAVLNSLMLQAFEPIAKFLCVQEQDIQSFEP